MSWKQYDFNFFVCVQLKFNFFNGIFNYKSVNFSTTSWEKFWFQLVFYYNKVLYSSSYAKKVHASSTTALSQLLSKTELSVFLNYQLKHKLVSLLSNQKWMYHTQTETLISFFERTLRHNIIILVFQGAGKTENPQIDQYWENEHCDMIFSNAYS